MNDSTLVLLDGRRLGWARYGDPEGETIVAMHGSPDSRIIWRLVDSAAADLGIRIIAPDRPGFGLSDPKRGRRVLDWVTDHDQLMAHLGPEHYRMIAVSGGSPYATAIAWSRPEQVTCLGLLSVISPLNAAGVLDGTNRAVRLTFKLALQAPLLLRPLATAMVMLAKYKPRTAEKQLIASRPPADRHIIQRPEVLAVLRANLPNQFRHSESIAREMRLAATNWGFPLDEIFVPTIIWQGGLDDVHTPAMANWLHATLPNSRLEYEPDYATFNFFDVVDDVLAALSRPPPLN